MNAVTPIATVKAEVGQPSDFFTLCGQMARQYARIEFDMVRAISHLDAKGKTPPTLTQRTARLKALLSGSADPRSKDVAKTLKDLEDHLDRRNILVHGSGAIASRGKGWLWPWEMKAGSKATIERGFWTDQEMRIFQKDLTSKSDRLHTHVERLCESKPA